MLLARQMHIEIKLQSPARSMREQSWRQRPESLSKMQRGSVAQSAEVVWSDEQLAKHVAETRSHPHDLSLLHDASSW